MSIRDLVIDFIPVFLDDVHNMAENMKNNTIVTDGNIQNKLMILYKLMQYYSKCKETHGEPKFEMPSIDTESTDGDDEDYFFNEDDDDENDDEDEDDDDNDEDDGEEIDSVSDSDSDSDIESEYEFDDVNEIQKDAVDRKMEIALVDLHTFRNDIVDLTKN